MDTLQPKPAKDLLDMYYLDMRMHLLEVAALFDRLDRSGGVSDPRLAQLRTLAVLAVDPHADRTRRALEFLSVP